MAQLEKKLTAPNGRDITLNTGLFIGNEFVPGSASPIESINPTKGQPIVSVQAASSADVDTAVKAARKAFTDPAWRHMPDADRGILMNKLADLIEADKELLATLETWDNGKPYLEALDGDVAEVIATLRYYAGWADKIHGMVLSKTGATGQKLAYTLKQPVGVCAQIIPWNYPLAMASWKLGPALATGNTIILKPAEQTPLSILHLASLIIKAGFPPGVINILNGLGREAGTALVSHPGIDHIAFTGSTATGKAIMRSAATNMTGVTLETGGKSPLLVFEDADLEEAAKWAFAGITGNAGQICTANSRILVQRSVQEKFLQLYAEAQKSGSVVGDPFDEKTTQGPQVSRQQYENVMRFIQKGKDEGARLVSGGAHFDGAKTKEGFFVQPTVFGDVTPQMDIFQEEIFGPVVAVTPFETEEEALELANGTQYGLAAAVFSLNVERAHRVAERLEAGTVWVNSSQDSDIRVPFGGVKKSGLGRELGEAGLAAYLVEKAVHVNLGMKCP